MNPAAAWQSWMPQRRTSSKQGQMSSEAWSRLAPLQPSWEGVQTGARRGSRKEAAKPIQPRDALSPPHCSTLSHLMALQTVVPFTASQTSPQPTARRNSLALPLPPALGKKKTQNPNPKGSHFWAKSPPFSRSGLNQKEKADPRSTSLTM